MAGGLQSHRAHDDRACPPDAPHCPNPACKHHEHNDGWHWVRDGFFDRLATPHRIQRFRCRHCGRRFSAQTFHVTYWDQVPTRLLPNARFHRLRYAT